MTLRRIVADQTRKLRLSTAAGGATPGCSTGKNSGGDWNSVGRLLSELAG